MTAADGSIHEDRRVMAFSAAAMYASATLDGAIEAVIPNAPPFSTLPIIIVFAMSLFMVTIGPRLSRPVLALNGPLGVALVSYALATTPASGSDAAVLYALPVLWLSLFFGRRGAASIIVLVALGDAGGLIALGGNGYFERWVDVMVACISIAVVVVALEERNRRLLSTVTLEARIDPLTGLLNRRGFDERVAQEFARAEREPEPFALVTFDIDHFKHVNDRWGHDVGDHVLCHVAAVLSAEARGTDVLARFGGEEFVALLPASDALGAARFAERVRDSLRLDTGGLPPVQVSAGVATGERGDEPNELLRAADEALYGAKRGGRNRTLVHLAA